MALAIEQRERKYHEFEVQGFFGLGDEAIHKLALRVATKAEEETALLAAHEKVRGAPESAREDNDLMSDAKLIQILFRVCFQVKDTEGHRYPAFPGPEWMTENMTTDQIACLINLYHEVRSHDEATVWTISMDDVRAMEKACAMASDTELPEAMLARFGREWLTQAFVLQSKRIEEMEAEIERHNRPRVSESIPSEAEEGT